MKPSKWFDIAAFWLDVVVVTSEDLAHQFRRWGL